MNKLESPTPLSRGGADEIKERIAWQLSACSRNPQRIADQIYDMYSGDDRYINEQHMFDVIMSDISFGTQRSITCL